MAHKGGMANSNEANRDTGLERQPEKTHGRPNPPSQAPPPRPIEVLRASRSGFSLTIFSAVLVAYAVFEICAVMRKSLAALDEPRPAITPTFRKRNPMQHGLPGRFDMGHPGRLRTPHQKPRLWLAIETSFQRKETVSGEPCAGFCHRAIICSARAWKCFRAVST